MAKAQEIDAVLISLDGDFADIINYPPKDFKGSGTSDRAATASLFYR